MEIISLVIFAIGFSWWFYNIIEIFRSIWYYILISSYKRRMKYDMKNMELDDFLEIYPDEAQNFYENTP